LKVLGRYIAQVKQRAEWVILVGNRRIGEEITKIPKTRGPGGIKGNKAASPPSGKSSGREATGVPHTPRARLTKLAGLTRDELETTAKELWESGKDATLKAVLGEIRQTELKQKRAAYEEHADRGATVGDLVAMAEAGQQFSVIYADPPWAFEVYSGKGKSRSAERHYDTSSLETIKVLPIAPLAAKNCALFLWCVMPDLRGALEVLKAWGFEFDCRCCELSNPSPSRTNATRAGCCRCDDCRFCGAGPLG
jgi:hypothetical protein